MKILWISPFLLHPTRSGGQIRSLGILSQLHRWNNIHVPAFQLPGQEDGVARMKEYCTSSDRIAHELPRRGSPRFLRQALENLWSPLPLTIARDRSEGMRQLITMHMAKNRYDVIVCDFLSMAVNISDLRGVVLFQHNVETVIWKRLAEQAPTILHRRHYEQQARRMFVFERDVCTKALQVVAVSDSDAATMHKLFGAERVSSIPTGVDVDYFQPPQSAAKTVDLVFTGSLNWIPNIDGLRWFISEVLPQIRRRKPDCSLAIVGRNPTPEIRQLVERDPLLELHADVPDIRPFLWGAGAAIVPLKVGGGTRLKIYEAMAAGLPQISTGIGAEGLEVENGKTILLADEPDDFAAACLMLLEDKEKNRQILTSALRMVRERFGWQQVAREFQPILERTRAAVVR